MKHLLYIIYIPMHLFSPEAEIISTGGGIQNTLSDFNNIDLQTVINKRYSLLTYYFIIYALHFKYGLHE